ncbi:MAG: hypothetical protein QOG51_518, partial [Verrucomicrobiota bacterium]
NIAEELQAQLSPKERTVLAARPTRDMVAYDLYLKAREIWRTIEYTDEERPYRKLALLEQAIARDPTFVPALYLDARIHLELYYFNFDHTAERLALATKALDQAERLGTESGERHLYRAMFHYYGERNYGAALAELEIARQTLPNDAEALALTAGIERRQGKWDESTRHIEEASRIDPRNLGIWLTVQLNYLAQKRYGDAARGCDQALGWIPRFRNFMVAERRAKVDLDRGSGLRRLRELVSGNAAISAAPIELSDARLDLAFAERDYAAARAALATVPLPQLRRGHGNMFVIPKEWFAGIIALHNGDPRQATEIWTIGLEKMAATVASRPDDMPALVVLGELSARLGRNAEALRASERVLESLAREPDAFSNPEMFVRVAGIYAQAGEKGRALDLLGSVAKLPNGPHYGELVLDEVWDPLRAEPRFAEIVQSLAPK